MNIDDQFFLKLAEKHCIVYDRSDNYKLFTNDDIINFAREVTLPLLQRIATLESATKEVVTVAPVIQEPECGHRWKFQGSSSTGSVTERCLRCWDTREIGRTR